MAIEPKIQRALVFSNPHVFIHGFPAGIDNERENARVLQETAPVLEIFSEVIFVARFETGTLELWSTAESLP